MVKEELTSRERVRLALEHKETDRVPLDLGGTFISTLTLGAYDRLKDHLAGTEGIKVEKPARIINKWGQTVRPDEEILQRLNIDTRSIYSKPPRYWRDLNYQNNSFVDEWGVLRQRSGMGKYYYYDIVGFPLADATSIDDLERFRWPMGNDPGRVEGLREEAQYLYEKTPYALVGNLMGVDIFELCWFLRGFENSLMDLMINQEFAHHMLNKLLEIQKQKFDLFLYAIGEYLDVVVILDDIATQKALFISPDTYRTMLKPYHKELIHFIKERTQAKLLYHTDGAVKPLINDLIEIGVDILQPVQVSAKGMDSDKLKAEFGDSICFWGGINNQDVLPNGTPEQIKAEVEKRIADFSPGGGYIFGAGHNVQFDVPPENVVTLFDHAFKSGWYKK